MDIKETHLDTLRMSKKATKMYLHLENSRTSSEDLEMTIAALKYPHSQNEDDLCHAVEIS